jgi:hypothetical protein
VLVAKFVRQQDVLVHRKSCVESIDSKAFVMLTFKRAYSVVTITVGQTSTVVKSSNAVVTSTVFATVKSTSTSEIVITTTISSVGVATVTSYFTSTVIETQHQLAKRNFPFQTSSIDNPASKPKESSLQQPQPPVKLAKRAVATYTRTNFFFTTITSGSTSTSIISSTVQTVLYVTITRTSTTVVGATSVVTISSTVFTTLTSTVTDAGNGNGPTVGPISTPQGGGNAPPDTVQNTQTGKNTATKSGTSAAAAQSGTATNNVPILQSNDGGKLHSFEASVVVVVVMCLLINFF